MPGLSGESGSPSTDLVSIHCSSRSGEDSVYLSELRLRGFCAFSDARISLRRDLTVLVGENSAGKSAVVSAIRLFCDPLDGRRSRWPSVDDVCRADVHELFEIEGVLRGTPGDLAGFIEAHCGADEESGDVFSSFKLTFTPPAGTDSRGRSRWLAGSGANESDPDPAARGRIRHVYLPPLRDAVRELGSAAGTRIRSIVSMILAEQDDSDEIQFVNRIKAHLDQVEQDEVLLETAKRINEPLERMTGGTHEHVSRLGYGKANLRSLVRGLRLKMADAGLDARELTDAGLGYANLAYIATVLIHLKSAAEADLTLLLVEEPEAHLHPQLQAVLLEFLRDTARDSQGRGSRSNGWLGRIQVVVTTHAPLLAAHSDVSDIVVLARRRATVSSGRKADASETEDSRPDPFIAIATAVNDLGLERSSRNKINRYLNATRNSLLFGPRTILVEGISEAILLPAFARTLLKGQDWTRFLGTAIVAIDGVDFTPYLEILLKTTRGNRIGQRVAVVTDLDLGQRSEQVAEMGRFISSCDANKITRVFVTPSTLEPELLDAGNATAFWRAWSRQKPRAVNRTKNVVTLAADRSAAIVKELKDSELRKGDFAQDFLQEADLLDELSVPDYLAQAIQWIVEDC